MIINFHSTKHTCTSQILPAYKVHATDCQKTSNLFLSSDAYYYYKCQKYKQDLYHDTVFDCLNTRRLFLKRGLDPINVKKKILGINHWPKLTILSCFYHPQATVEQIWFYKNGWTWCLFGPSF